MRTPRHPSPALILATLSLFISLGGTSYAVSKNSVGASEIKSNAVRSSEIKKSAVDSSEIKADAVGSSEVDDDAISAANIINDSLTGSDISESSLATVPTASSSQTAASASTAGSADAVDGFSFARIDFRHDAVTPATQVLDLGGLRLTASCDSGAEIAVTASTSSDGSMLHAGNEQANSSEDVDDGDNNDDDNSLYAEQDDFDTGDSVDILPTTASSSEADDSVQGSLTYINSSGGIVTATYLVEEDQIGMSSPYHCVFVGTAAYAAG